MDRARGEIYERHVVEGNKSLRERVTRVYEHLEFLKAAHWQ